MQDQFIGFEAILSAMQQNTARCYLYLPLRENLFCIYCLYLQTGLEFFNPKMTGFSIWLRLSSLILANIINSLHDKYFKWLQLDSNPQPFSS